MAAKGKAYVSAPTTTAKEAKDSGNKVEYFRLKLAASSPKSKNHAYFARHLARAQKEAQA